MKLILVIGFIFLAIVVAQKLFKVGIIFRFNRIVNKINKYAELSKLSNLEKEILYTVHINNYTRAGIMQKLYKLSETQLKEILNRFIEMGMLKKTGRIYCLNLEEFKCRDKSDLELWERKIIYSFWHEGEDYAPTFNQLKLKFAKPTQEELTNAILSLEKIGFISLREYDKIYKLDITEIDKKIIMYNRIKQDQNSE